MPGPNAQTYTAMPGSNAASTQAMTWVTLLRSIMKGEGMMRFLP